MIWDRFSSVPCEGTVTAQCPCIPPKLPVGTPTRGTNPHPSVGQTDTGTDRLQHWAGSLENLDLEHKGLLQREWDWNRKKSQSGGLWGELLSNTCTGVNEQGKHQNRCLQCQEEGKYNVCFLHYPKQFSSLISWMSLGKVRNDTLFYTCWKGLRGHTMLEGRFGCNLYN